MVKCFRDGRFLTILIAIILTPLPEIQAICHQNIVLKESKEEPLNTNNSKREIQPSTYQENWPREKNGGNYEPDIKSKVTGYDEKTTYGRNDYDNDMYDDSYEYEESSEYRDRTFGKFLLAGSIVLLLLGLCGIIHFVSKKDSSRSLSVTQCYRSHYSNYNSNNVRDKNTCLVNVMREASSDISENESYFRNIPLPLIYEDRGKICKNAEMFIQRCMTNSLKRTYSAPIESPSTINFNKPSKELTRPIKTDPKIKETLKEEKKIEDIKNAIRQQIQHPKNEGHKTKDSGSSSTLSIASLLLKPQYQCKNIYRYKSDNKEHKKMVKKRSKAYGKNKKSDKLAVNKKRHSIGNSDRRKISSINPRKKVSIKGSREVTTLRPKRKMITYDKRLMKVVEVDESDQSSLICKRGSGIHEKQFNFHSEGSENKINYHGTVSASTTSKRNIIPGNYDSSKKTMQNLDYLIKQIRVMADNGKQEKNQTSNSTVKRQPLIAYEIHNARDNYNNTTAGPLALLELKDKTRKNMMIRRYEQLEYEVETLRRKLQEFATEFIFNEEVTAFQKIGESNIKNDNEGVQQNREKKRKK